MDSQTKINVDFKPAKRMKKRRELDALVNGKQTPSFRSSGRMFRNGKHELLRDESESSEVEEFILPEKSLVRKQGHSSICSVCVTVCWGFLLIICLVGIGGLVWMCIQLKKDVDQLRAQLDKVGMQNVNMPGELHDIFAGQESLSGRLSRLESGDGSIEKLRESISLLTKQVVDLNGTTRSLSQSIANAPQLQLLPQQVKDLSKNVAELGSNLATMAQSVAQLQQVQSKAEHQLKDIDARLQSVQLASKPKLVEDRDKLGSHEAAPSDIKSSDNLLKDLSTLNTTVYAQLGDLKTRYSAQQVSVLELFNYTDLLNTRLTFLEVRPEPLNQNEVMLTVTAVVQNMLEEFRNMSSDQTAKQHRPQLDSLIALLQAQIMSHEKKISTLQESLRKFNVSLTDLENATELNIELLKSKLWSLSERLKTDVIHGVEQASLIPPVNSSSYAEHLSVAATTLSPALLPSTETGSLSTMDGGNKISST